MAEGEPRTGTFNPINYEKESFLIMCLFVEIICNILVTEKERDEKKRRGKYRLGIL